jgi:hypothetical protein
MHFLLLGSRLSLFLAAAQHPPGCSKKRTENAYYLVVNKFMQDGVQIFLAARSKPTEKVQAFCFATHLKLAVPHVTMHFLLVGGCFCFLLGACCNTAC